MPTPPDFAKVFTPKQCEKLQTASFNNLYDFITYLPKDFIQVEVLSGSFFRSDCQYLWQANLTNFAHHRGKKPYLVLQFADSNRTLVIYFFSITAFTLKTLKIDQEYQLLLTFQNSSWRLLKFAPVYSQKEEVLNLGKAKIQPYILPKYEKRGILTQNDFLNLHKRLLPSQYVLNLQGLLPENNIIPNIINLYSVHHPRNQTEFVQTIQSWQSLKVFLRLVLMKYLANQGQKTAPTSSLNIDFLKKLSNSLPFTLSPSQKQTIWEILQELCSFR